MRRREFIALGGMALSWPLVARAQQAARVRTIGVLLPLVENDSVAREEVDAFVTALQQVGWIEGRAFRDSLGRPDPQR